MAAGAGLALAIFLWVALAPQSLGGGFSYVFISGNSMAPGITDDDLVLLRAADDYDVGDAVAYTHPQLGTVLHRIVADDGYGFTLRGDNRTSDDSYHPAEHEILGRLWITVPNGAAVIREVQTPRNAALLTVATVAVGMVSTRIGGAGGGRRGPEQPPRRRDRRRRGRPMSGRGGGGGGPPPAARGSSRSGRSGGLGGSGGTPEDVPRRGRGPGSLSFFSSSHQPLAMLVALLLGSAALIGFVRVRGTTHMVSEMIPYIMNGAFAYSATVEGGVYDGDQLGAPEPVFRRLTDRLPLDYQFALDPGAPGLALTDVTGSYQLEAVVSLENGWKRTINLTPTTLFAGSEFTASAIVELADVQAIIDRTQEATGIVADIYNLSIRANVDYEADLAGQPVSGSTQQLIEFRLTALQLQFNPRTSDIEATVPSTIARDVSAERSMPIPVVGVTVPYRSIPTLALYGVGVAMAGLLAMLLATALVWRAGEAARIHARYGRLIVDVRYDELELAARVLTVDQFEDLARIAESEGLMVFHRLARPQRSTPDRWAFDRDNVSELRDGPRQLAGRSPVDDADAIDLDAVDLLKPRRVLTERPADGAAESDADEYFVVDRDIAFRYTTGDLPYEAGDDGAYADARDADVDERDSEVA